MFVESHRSLQSMFDRADVVVRGTVVRTGVAALYAYGSQGRLPRDAPVLTLGVTETFKGSAVPELHVITDVCPSLDADPRSEWFVFAYRADQRYGPEGPTPHHHAVGGPQGQLRVVDGRLAGPYYAVQRVARELSGTPAADLAAKLRTMTGADVAARSLFERHGWTVVRTDHVGELTLPAAAAFGNAFADLCGAAPLAHCADLGARAGLDLRTGAGSDARVLTFVLEFPTPIGGGAYPPSGRAVAVGDRIVGAWVVSAVTRDVYAVTDRALVPVGP